jgi:hypothetical protein
MAIFEYDDSICPHCPHPKHEGVCGVMVPIYPGQTNLAQIACQCRVEPSLPSSFREGWIRTYTGLKFHFFDPHPDEICIEDIAHHLSLKNRFQGATRVPYSVALHSILGAAYALEIKKDRLLAQAFLLHDAEEAYFPDVPSPMKHAIPWWNEATSKAEAVIFEKFGVDHALAENFALKQIDRMLVDEEGEFFIENWQREFTAGPCMELRMALRSSASEYWESVEERFHALYHHLWG